jgi:putative transposase
VWLADLTEIRGFLGLVTYKLVVVMDLFSRMPLASGVFASEPSASEVLAVLDRAVCRHGPPRHFVSDRGAQFTSAAFRGRLAAHAVRQRFGAVGQYGSIAIVERFWRTLKGLLGVRLSPALSKTHLEHRVDRALCYYACLRPHQGLAGATPAEVFNDVEQAAASAVRPPRRTARSPTSAQPLPLAVVYLDPERRLPVLVPTRNAA